MRKLNSELKSYPAPVLRVVFRSLTDLAMRSPLQDRSSTIEKSKTEKTGFKNETEVCGYCQHYIKPKRFDFF